MYLAESASSEPNTASADAPQTGFRRDRSSWVVIAATLSLLGALVWALNPHQPRLSPAPLKPVARACEKMVREFLPSNITEIPRWDKAPQRQSPSDAANAAAFRALSDRQREKALLRLNTEPCTCGCNLSIASCTVNEPDCDFSGKQARKVIEPSKH